MHSIKIENRAMTTDEYYQMKRGFDNHSQDNQVEVQHSDRFSFVATEAKTFIAAASGLAYKNGEKYSGWFYLTDLFVEKPYRGQGLGSKLMQDLEQKMISLGILQIMTWTAGYEAPSFYEKKGFEPFVNLENWYSDGSSRIGYRKKLVLSGA